MFEYINEYAGFGWNGLTDFIIPFIIVLSVLVFVHEWGHYIVARMCGVKVTQFSIGFGKEIFGWTDSKGTRWKFSMIPLGGYVQMFGDTDPSSASNKAEILENEENRPMTEEEKRTAFFTQPVWQRAAIVFAGPAVNFLFAIILLFGLYSYIGKPVTPPVAAGVMVDGAGYSQGVKPGDRIVSIDGSLVESFSDIQKSVAISLDRPVDIVILRGDEEMTLNVTPRVQTMEDRFGFSSSRGMIGIMGIDSAISVESIQSINGRDVSGLNTEEKQKRIDSLLDQDITIGLPTNIEGELRIIAVHLASQNQAQDGEILLTELSEKEYISYNNVGALNAAVKETWFILTGTMEALGQIITGTRSPTELGGIVRIGAVAGDAAQAGLIALITFTALLSVNLGLINLFPIPLLDGGHLVFYAYEAIFKKPMSEKVMDYALKLGMIFLFSLMAFANINDIVQLAL